MSLPSYLQNIEERKLEPIPDGDYEFVVLSAEPKVAQSGTKYTKLKLDIKVSSERSVKGYDSIFYSSKALFRLKQFVEATGVNLPESLDNLQENPECYVGQTGVARFKKNEDGYLDVAWYSKQGSKPSVAESHPAVKAVQAGEDNIPF